MSLTVEDLKPRNYEIEVKGVKLECKPMELHQTVVMASVGNIFNNLADVDINAIKKAEKDLKTILPDIIPSLNGIELDGETILDIINQLTIKSKPSDEQYLNENGVETDPKAEKAG